MQKQNLYDFTWKSTVFKFPGIRLSSFRPSYLGGNVLGGSDTPISHCTKTFLLEQFNTHLNKMFAPSVNPKFERRDIRSFLFFSASWHGKMSNFALDTLLTTRSWWFHQISQATFSKNSFWSLPFTPVTWSKRKRHYLSAVIKSYLWSQL